jgi:hypothetical protein
MSNKNFESFFVDMSVHWYADKVGENLEQHGVCTFHIWEKAGLVRLIHEIGSSVKHAGTDQDGIMTIFPDLSREKKWGGNGGAYGRDVLPFHTDGKWISECLWPNWDKRYGPADILILHAQQIVKPKIAVPTMCDGRALYSDLESSHGEILRYLLSSEAIRGYTTLPDHTYSWPLIQMIRWRIALRLDPDWCGHWPGWYLEGFTEIMRRNTFEIILHTGDGYILDNRRMLHGRWPIWDDNPRTLHHTLVYPEGHTPIGKHIFPYSLVQS